MRRTALTAIAFGAAIGFLCGLINLFVFDGSWASVLVSTILFSLGQVVLDVISVKRVKPRLWE